MPSEHKPDDEVADRGSAAEAATKEELGAPPPDATEFEQARWYVQHKPGGRLRKVFRANNSDPRSDDRR
ncbi:hypothetical protein [Glycomyces xiaoerkulensis]|uniref:hypothetical protein n=1 Tax=Glycomyces xiaoerkulensis TaxID=2038139 RepID=UPI000C26295A|nr:hypothetical protein [Glycomyces xiaoerkulensis]